MKAPLTLLLASSLVLCACEKETNEERKPLEPTAVNLMGTYKIIKVLGKQGNTAAIDITESYFPELCERDDVYHFKSENVYNRQDAGMQCNPGTARSGSWQLLNPTTMVINGEQASIDRWNGKNLDVTVDYGGGVRVTFNYLKQ